MRYRKRTMWPAALVAGLLTLALLSPAWAQQGKPPGVGRSPAYTILPFAPLGADSNSTNALDLNERGEVIGYAQSSAGELTWWHLDLVTAKYTQLPDGFLPRAISNAGQMVGGTRGLPPAGSFLPGIDAESVSLPPLAGDNASLALDINDDGFIVGLSAGGSPDDGTHRNTAVAWKADVDPEGVVTMKGPVALLPLAGDVDSVAFRINDPLEGPILAAGLSAAQDAPEEAAVWSLGLDAEGELEAGSPTGLGTLGRFEPGITVSDGRGINGFGDVCGRSDGKPFLFRAGGEMQMLPVPRGTLRGPEGDYVPFGHAYDVNDLGEVVGYYNTTGGFLGTSRRCGAPTARPSI